MGSLDDSLAVHNLNKKIVMGDNGYVLEDVPHLSDYIPSLPTYPNPLKKGASVLFKEITRYSLNVVVVGIPKTIDNDIPIIDKSFGFDSAVEEAHVEAMSFDTGIGVVKLMGRDSDPTYMIRAIASNASDKVYCTLVAQSAVHGAMAGYTGFTVGPVNNTHSYIPFDRIIEKQNKVDITDMMWAQLLSSTNQPCFLSTTRSVDIIEANKDEEPPIQLSDGETNSC
ncbi:hypothetical protein H5410_023768 [Solanum commersonii]|uniref:Phosphofructokinase domain-containing protein n=1 Tax=Solanum commersonii TaxID=4109 RepID=A0A9J5ZJH3_SOLCO|nr:hypothetical protein H5410_023768 [Solanum commersonii]